MNFEKGYIYHIYNQGNNKQKIFFNRGNYLFFLKKIKTHILPYADILSWCLMPNHFHLMVYVKYESLPAGLNSQGFTLSKTLTVLTDLSETLTNADEKKRTFNESIGIMLRTYTRAVNKQKNLSGSLFRKETKAVCINCPNGISPSWFSDNGITRINTSHPEKQYPQICFNYIHQNPVKARLVKKITDWEFSSAKDYFEKRNGKLIDKELAKEYIVFSEK